MQPTLVQQKKVSVSDFKAHCTEYLRAVESGETEFIITKHSKVIAITKAVPSPGDSSALLGAAKGTASLSKTYDPHASAFAEDDWDMNQ